MKKIIKFTIIFSLLISLSGCDKKSGNKKSSSKTDPIINPDGSETTNNPDGSTSTTFPDGRVITKNTDGSTSTTFPDGTITTTNPDGSITTTNPDGSVLVLDPEGSVADESSVLNMKFLAFPQGESSYNQLPSDQINDLDIDSAGVLYAATSLGLGISTDLGNTFSIKTTNDGLFSNRIKKVLVHSDNLVFVSTFSSLHLTRDKGATFQTIGNNISVSEMKMINNRLYMIVDNFNNQSKVLMRSDEGFSQFEVINSSRHESFDFSENKIYAAIGKDIFVADFTPNIQNVGQYQLFATLEASVSIVIVHNDKVLVGTKGKGIKAYDFNGANVASYSFDNSYAVNFITDMRIINNQLHVSSVNGYRFGALNQNNLVDAFTQADLSSSNPQNPSVRVNTIEVFNNITYLATTKSGLFISSEVDGISTFSPVRNNTYDSSVVLKFLSDDNYIYTLFNFGLYKTNKETNETTRIYRAFDLPLRDFVLVNNSHFYVTFSRGVKKISKDGTLIDTYLENNNCLSIVEMDNHLYVAIFNSALTIIDFEGNSKLSSGAFISPNIKRLETDGQNVLIVSDSGIQYINNQFQIHKTIMHPEDFSYSSPNAIMFDFEDQVFLLAVRKNNKYGIFRFNPDASDVSFVETGLFINSIKKLSGVGYVFGTNLGLVLVDNNFQELKRYDHTDGLSNNYVVDSHIESSTFYLATRAGLSKSFIPQE